MPDAYLAKHGVRQGADWMRLLDLYELGRQTGITRKFFGMYKNFLLPTSILAGTIIGAGIFALPFVFKNAGLSLGFFYLFISVAVYSLIYLMYADIFLRTKGEHRFIGFAEIYLGKKSFWITILMTLVSKIFTLAVFLVLSVSFLNLIMPQGAEIGKMLIFWLVGTGAVFLSLKRISALEFLIVSGMLMIVFLVFFLGLGGINEITLPDFSPNPANLFFPLGIIFFALAGREAIPSLINNFRAIGLGNNYKKIKTSIITATSIPIIFYIMFVFGILALSETVSPDSVSGLVSNVPQLILVIIGVLGFLSLWSTYILLGVNAKDILRYDLKFSAISRFLVIAFAPLIIYFLSLQDFIGLVGIAGGIFLALEGLFIIVMWLNAKHISDQPSVLLPKLKKPWIAIPVLIFVVTLVNEIINLFV